MIDPKIKSGRRFGVQGSLNFDTTSLSANPVLYKEMRELMQGVHGFGGAGGVRAHRLNSGTEFSESQVYKTKRERDAVQRRLEAQLTDQLNARYGETAQAAGMSVPEFLQKQGVGGIREVGEGDARRMTAFGVDNFQEVTFNPLLSSNEKAIRSMVKSSGGFSDHFGGTNEHRRVKALVRAPLAREIGERSRKVALDLETGLGNKGDLEGAYLSRAEKMMVNNKRKTVNNAVIAGEAFSEEPALVEKLRSDMIKEDQTKKLREKIRREAEEEGLISPKEEKGRKESPAKVAAKGGLVILSLIMTTLATMKTILATGIGFLKAIAQQTAKEVLDAGGLGISADRAKNMHLWGKKHTLYTQGNHMLLIDAAKEYKAKFGDITKFEKNANFTSAAFNAYAGEVIDNTVQAAIKKDPVNGMGIMFGAFAKRYMSHDSPEARRKELMIQENVLTDEFSATIAQAYVAMLLGATAPGKSWLTKKNAHNMYFEATSDRRVALNDDEKTRLGPDSLTRNVAGANEAFGNFELLKDSLMMKLFSQIDILIQAMYMLGDALLTVLVGLKVSGAKEQQDAWRKTRKEAAVKGYAALDTSTEQYKQSVFNNIDNFLGARYKGDAKVKARNEIFNTLFLGGSLPKEFEGVLGGQRGVEILAGMSAFKLGESRLSQIHNDVVKKGIYRTDGDTTNLMKDAWLNYMAYRERYETLIDKEKEINYRFTDKVGNTGISKGVQQRIKDTASGKLSKSIMKDNSIKVNIPGVGEVTVYHEKKEVDVRDTETQEERILREQQEKIQRQINDAIPGFKKGDKSYNLNPIFAEFGALAMAGRHDIISKGSSTQSSEPVTIVHNVNLKVNDKDILHASTNIDADSANRFFVQNSQANLG